MHAVEYHSQLSCYQPPSHRYQAWSAPLILAIITCFSSAACSDDGGSTMVVDAPTMPPDAWQRYCWFGSGQPTATSEIALGVGLDTYEAIVDEQTVELVHGFQGGVHLELSARMRGLHPGDLDDDDAPAPHTLYTLFDESDAVMSAADCAFPRQYRDIGEEWYQIDYGNIVIIRDNLAQNLDGKRIRIQAEIQDPFGNYARTEHWVIIDDPLPPLADAGVVDAGTDAGVDAAQ